MPVGGTRHYGGPGLGQEGLWRCPSCGEDNTGPISHGCPLCGGGQPGSRAEPPPPPPAAAASRITIEHHIPHLEIAEQWAVAHPDGTLIDAYTAGYLDGIRAARAAQPPAPPEPEPDVAPGGKVGRTLIAALELFRDQVLIAAPEEVAAGEWCSVSEVNQLLQQLQQQQQQPQPEEAAHA